MTTQGVKFEVVPAEHWARLAQHAGLHRVVYNACLAAVKANLSQREAERSYGIADDDLTPVLGWGAPSLEAYWRRVRDQVAPWFAEEKLSSRVPKEACRALSVALSNWSKSRKGKRRGARVGFPRFKSLRKSGRQFRYDANRAKPVGTRHISLPGVGTVRSREDMSWLTSRLEAGTARILGASISERAGRWWVSFQVDVQRDNLNTRRAAPADGGAAGIDLGLKAFATIAHDDGTVEQVDAPKHLVRSLRKLRRLNRELARRQFDPATRHGSQRREKTKKKLAKAHLTVANQRNDFLHKLTTRLARTKPAIAVEQLNTAGMLHNRSLSRAIADASWGEFLRQLEYKTSWYGGQLVKADRFYPSSKTCSDCGTVKPALLLSERTFACTGCGLVLDRDANAARNLLALIPTEAAAPAA